MHQNCFERRYSCDILVILVRAVIDNEEYDMEC